MKWLTRILIGIGTIFGAIFGFAAVFNNDEVRARLKDHYEESLKTARQAAANKRQELETLVEEEMKAEGIVEENG